MPGKSLGSKPSNDSSVCTKVPPPRASKVHLWTAEIPSVRPFHATLVGRTTSSNWEEIGNPPAFQRNFVPGAIGPSTLMEVTSVFHFGQAAKSVRPFQTTVMGASIKPSDSALTGALSALVGFMIVIFS